MQAASWVAVLVASCSYFSAMASPIRYPHPNETSEDAPTPSKLNGLSVATRGTIHWQDSHCLHWTIARMARSR